LVIVHTEVNIQIFAGVGLAFARTDMRMIHRVHTYRMGTAAHFRNNITDLDVGRI